MLRSALPFLLTCAAVLAVSAVAAPPQLRTIKDGGKTAIENPLKAVVRQSAPRSSGNTVFKPRPPASRIPKDAEKRDIEVPLKRVVRDSAPPAEKATETKPAGFKNPKVEPGKVRWHANFEKAVAASKRSGRPVLLFQMIGNLDERFS